MMKPEEINVAIAEACGWKNVGRYWLPPQLGMTSKLHRGDDGLPCFTIDLNACHEMEETLTEIVEQDRYLDGLYTAIIAPVEVEYGSVSWTENSTRWVFMHATAPQRCEAFLRTKGKWNA